MNTVLTLQYYGIKLTKILPYKVADKIATVIGLLFCHLSKKKRSYIQRNLMYIFYSQDVQPEQMNRYVKNTFINFARMMVDFFRLCYMTKDDFDVERVGFERCLKMLLCVFPPVGILGQRPCLKLVKGGVGWIEPERDIH